MPGRDSALAALESWFISYLVVQIRMATSAIEHPLFRCPVVKIIFSNRNRDKFVGRIVVLHHDSEPDHFRAFCGVLFLRRAADL
jgi:hypothetical protein